MPKRKTKTTKRTPDSTNRMLFWALMLILLLTGWAIYYWNYLRLAHSTFENYYVYRGCTELLQRTDTFGICKTSSGQTIKIVKYNGKWYLNGDLPVCSPSWLCF